MNELNVAIGNGAGMSVIGVDNSAIGTAVNQEVTGNRNTANGNFAGREVSGSNNTASGYNSGNDVDGSDNTASGLASGDDVTGNGNTASGLVSGQNVDGDANAAYGSGAGQHVTGDNIIAFGTNAGSGTAVSPLEVSDTVAVGSNALHRPTAPSPWAGARMPLIVIRPRSVTVRPRRAPPAGVWDRDYYLHDGGPRLGGQQDGARHADLPRHLEHRRRPRRLHLRRARLCESAATCRTCSRKSMVSGDATGN